MSRTTLCTVTAGVLALLSLGVMLVRHQVLGDEVHRPAGPNVWKVELVVRGTSQGGARVATAAPLEFDRQGLVAPGTYTSDQMAYRVPEQRHRDRRRVYWSQRPSQPDGPFKVRAEYLVALQSGRAGLRGRLVGELYRAPGEEEALGREPLIEADDERINVVARRLAQAPGAQASRLDLAQVLFGFVEQQTTRDVQPDGAPASAVACLEQRGGDSAARSRLLVALLRNRGIPARLVTGVALTKGREQQAHCWVEAYLQEAWMPMCPTYRLFGRVPSTYLVLGFGDRPVVAAKHVTGLKYAFLVERQAHQAAADDNAWKRVFRSLSLYTLPPSDRRLAEVLLLLPLAALIICVFRNLIGLGSFGTFAPALIGLAFHDLQSLPGILVFVSILLVGWLMRRVLDGYHLLQVPRVALMLTLIMSVMLGLVVLSHHSGATATRYLSLFPMVILTGMVERFWTLETEDSTVASFRTLLQTMFIALVVALVLSRPLVIRHLFCYPETLGLVMAGQLLIGRYTGYRLMELIRFRDFLRPSAPATPGYTT